MLCYCRLIPVTDISSNSCVPSFILSVSQIVYATEGRIPPYGYISDTSTRWICNGNPWGIFGLAHVDTTGPAQNSDASGMGIGTSGRSVPYPLPAVTTAAAPPPCCLDSGSRNQRRVVGDGEVCSIPPLSSLTWSDFFPSLHAKSQGRGADRQYLEPVAQ